MSDRKSFSPVFGSNQLHFSNKNYNHQKRIFKNTLMMIVHKILSCKVSKILVCFVFFLSSTSLTFLPNQFPLSNSLYKTSLNFCYSFFIIRILMLDFLCNCVWLYFEQRIECWKSKLNALDQNFQSLFSSGGNIDESPFSLF